ncbi:MAG: hypothetical protein RIF33_21170 [Cyclobacteriaceae bacterium]
MKSFTCIIVCGLLLLSCRSAVDQSQSAHAQVEPTTMEVLAKEKLGEGFKTASRLNRLLVWKSVAQGQVVFLVFDSEKGSIVYEEYNPVRSVSWHADDEIKVRPYARIPSESPENEEYYVNITTNEKRTWQKVNR